MERDILLIRLVVMVICGVIAAAIASSKDRSVVGWFFGGFFLALIGIIIVAVLPNLKEQRSKEVSLERENRRLREQISQEQVKGEAFRRHASERLDTHDVHLGLDTRATNPLLAGRADSLALEFENWQPLDKPLAETLGIDHSAAVPPAPAVPPATAKPAAPNTPQSPVARPAASGRQWFIVDNGERRGPVSEEQLVGLIQSKQVTAQTLVWTEQLRDWKMAGQIVNLRRWLPS
jgi:type II secretory pathway pseudopilin PulG